MSFVNKLKFVKKQLETGDIYTFYFSLPKNLNHKAGQHGLFILPGLYRPHPFTLSSSPDEEFVTVSTHVNTGSRYKQKLMSMKDGDSIFMLGPILNFTFDKLATKYVLLSQGIGITPFRSMLVHAHAKAMPVTTTLIHVDSNEHAFRQLTEQYATTAFYPAGVEEFQAQVKAQDIDQLFYISGSPRFVSATRELLLKQNVKAHNIRTDSFLGY